MCVNQLWFRSVTSPGVLEILVLPTDSIDALPSINDLIIANNLCIRLYRILRLIRILYKNPSMPMHRRSNCYDFIDSRKSIRSFPTHVLATCTKESVWIFLLYYLSVCYCE